MIRNIMGWGGLVGYWGFGKGRGKWKGNFEYWVGSFVVGNRKGVRLG